MASEEARLLPVVEWGGREFLVDVEGRQFRNVNDAGDFIDMYSPQGRAIVRQTRNTEWRSFAVNSGGQKGATV